MIGFLFVVALIAAFYLYVYKKWDVKKKLTCMAILVYLTASFTLLLVFVTIYTVGDVVENEQADMKQKRLSRAEDLCMGGEYAWLAMELVDGRDYEEDFEPYWERAGLYNGCNRYLVFRAAAEAGLGPVYEEKAEEFGSFFEQLSQNPQYAENAFYADFFAQKAGMEAKQ